MRRTLAFLGGLGVGIGLMYLFDPQAGVRRRARLRDRAIRLGSRSQEFLGRRGRDLRHRVRGTASGLRHAVRRDHPIDSVLVERVRSKMGRYTSHARAIEVQAHDGRVTLAGPILAEEVHELLKAVESVRGVREIVNSLEPHTHEDAHPSLQGGTPPTGEARRFRTRPAVGVLTGIAGIAAGAYGARALRRSLAGRHGA